MQDLKEDLMVQNLNRYKYKIIKRKTIKSGNIKNSINLPFTKLFNDDKTFKNKEELENIFGELNLNKDDKIICSCGFIKLCKIKKGTGVKIIFLKNI
jgi:hypothetical protein